MKKNMEKIQIEFSYLASIFLISGVFFPISSSFLLIIHDLNLKSIEEKLGNYDLENFIMIPLISLSLFSSIKMFKFII